jgi:membrane protein required for colicin V production
MPDLLTRSNAASARFFAILTFLGAYTAYSELGALSAIVIAAGGVALWILTGDPENHGAIRRGSRGGGFAHMIITGLDFIIIVVTLISALLAMVRGLTREVLSIASWVAAAVATLYFFPRFQETVREMLQPSWLADVSLGLGIFIITLLVVSFITMRISDFILDSRVGVLDRTLGFVFGALRGLLLVVIGFMFFVWLVPEENQPEWITEARSKPFLEQTGEALISLLPEDPERAILDRLRRDGRPIPGLEPGAPAEEEDLDNSPAQQLDDLIDGTLEDEAT